MKLSEKKEAKVFKCILLHLSRKGLRIVSPLGVDCDEAIGEELVALLSSFAFSFPNTLSRSPN